MNTSPMGCNEGVTPEIGLGDRRQLGKIVGSVFHNDWFYYVERQKSFKVEYL